MDARITKQRLANMLSYDWLKILGAIALAAVFFCVIFMMFATRATDGQKFYVYIYNGLTAGGDFNGIERDMAEKGVFSYDILDTGSETFTKDSLYGNSVFSARRSSGEGRVMFVDDVRTEDQNGNESSTLLKFIEYAGTANESFNMFLDPQEFLSDCEKYLTRFFGEGLTGELNKDEARAAFTERNGKDKRFRTSAKKEAGVLQEEERLKKLRDDYLFVSEAAGDTLEYRTYTGYEGKIHTLGFSMKSVNKITSLVYYTVDGENGEKVQKQDDVVLCLFDNKKREGDLKYETVSFLAYLLRTYQK